jgi:FimV-like protein
MGKSIDASNPLYGPSAAASWEGEASGMDRSMISFDASESLNVTSDALRASAQAQPGSQARAGLGESFKSSKKVAAEAASVTDFDSTSISLNSPTATLPATAKQHLDRLDATLALAEQFIAIDEKEGARALLEEVMAGGNEALRQRAKTLLARMK